MAEQQISHRQRMENKFLNFNGWGEILGVLFAGTAVIGGLAGGIYLLMHDKPISGFTVMLTPLSAVAAAFLQSKRSQAKQIAKKR